MLAILLDTANEVTGKVTDVNAVDPKGKTALFVAIEFGMVNEVGW
jgi:hypothetical protein